MGNDKTDRNQDPLETATFGAGCFWCVEAVFQSLDGVHEVLSGYSGGRSFNPTYEEVCAGNTGHAEVAQLRYDPKIISYDELLEIFWSTHDPTTLNRQGADVGDQYRSVIFYHSDLQKKRAENYKARLNQEEVFGAAVVTEIVPFKEFIKAEEYHQDYFSRNRNKPYCQHVIIPKLEKFRKMFGKKISK